MFTEIIGKNIETCIKYYLRYSYKHLCNNEKLASSIKIIISTALTIFSYFYYAFK